MKQKVIAIVSVLKPIDDSRIYEKIGHSMGQTNKYDVNIIGFWTKNIPVSNNIHFYPIFKFRRTQWKRLTASWKIYKLLLKLKPDVTIVNTPEILPVISINKILFGTRILYDVQENHYKNIRTGGLYPEPVKTLLSAGIRMIEKMCAPLVDHFILAEQTYAGEMPLTKGKATIIENKFKISNDLKPIVKKQRALHFIYSGTIGKAYGIFDAIAFAKAAFALNSSFRLTIAGYCADQKTYRKLQSTIEGLSYINISGGDQLLPHHQILELIQQADFALLPYPLNDNLENRIPTKMYECIYFQTPMIIRPAPLWQTLGKQFNACYYFDYNFNNPLPLADICQKQYYDRGNVSNILWQNEEPKLFKVLESVLLPPK